MAHLEEATFWELVVAEPGFVYFMAQDVVAAATESLETKSAGLVLPVSDADEHLIALRRGFVIAGQIIGLDRRFPGRLSVDASRGGLQATDADGRFRLGPLQAGRWTLQVSPEGYVPQRRTLHIANADDVHIEVALQPTPGLELGF